MTQMSLMNFFKKGAEAPFEHEAEFKWQEDAACRFQPHTLFEIASKDSPIAYGLTVNEIKDLNEANFDRAKEICNTCPVFDLCYTSAEESDFDWTVRAGILPVKYNSTPQGRPLKGDPSKCPKGHSNWKLRPGEHGGRRCITCHSEASRLRRREKNPEGIDPTKPSLVGTARGKLCKYNHDSWVKRKGDYGYDCLTCRRERNLRNQQARREAARMSA